MTDNSVVNSPVLNLRFKSVTPHDEISSYHDDEVYYKQNSNAISSPLHTEGSYKNVRSSLDVKSTNTDLFGNYRNM